MRRTCLQLLMFLVAPAALSGCLTTETTDPTGSTGTAAVIDESVLTASAGTDTDPYLLPIDMPAGTDGGIYDYLNADPDGFWKIDYSGIQVDLGTGTPVFGDLIYDETAKGWRLTVDDTQYAMNKLGIGYATDCSVGSGSCAGFVTYNDPNKTLYGVFGYIGYTDQSTTASVVVMHAGLSTTDMPKNNGKASYSGVFAGALIGLSGEYATLGTTTIDVNFGVATEQVTFSSKGDVYDVKLIDYDITDVNITDVGDYTLDGSATIAGNTYTSSTITGTSTGAISDTTYSGDLDAAFYGPGAVQTAGAVVTTSDTGNILGGGYWAEKQ